MKKFCISFSMILVFSLLAKAESDTLVIKLKNNQIEKIAISQIQKIRFENITSVTEISKINNNLQVNENYPNPFTDQTSIEFEINSPGVVEITIFDNSGNKIQVLKCENCQTGKNVLLWDCLDMNKNKIQNGIYYYEVKFNNEFQSKKMLMIK